MNKDKKNIKKLDKGLIFLKSSVIALGLIFLVLLSLLLFLKLKKGSDKTASVSHKKISAQYCNDSSRKIIISSPISKIIDTKSGIILLTKVKNNQQELLTLDKKCGLILNRKRFVIKSRKVLNN